MVQADFKEVSRKDVKFIKRMYVENKTVNIYYDDLLNSTEDTVKNLSNILGVKYGDKTSEIISFAHPLLLS